MKGFIQAWAKEKIAALSPLFGMLGLIAVFAIAFSSGDSEEEKAQKAAAERTALINAISTASAEKLEAQIKELRANEVHTERIIQTETVKPVFTRICATDEYVRLLNESIDRAERTLSGQSNGPLPEHVAPPGG